MKSIESEKRPDVVLLVLDTQRTDRLSCYGCCRDTTPHLDAFAADANRFTQAISPAQWTPPAHASLFTGVYPSQHGVWQMDSVLPTALPTLAERIKAAGYFTAAFSNNPFIGDVHNGLARGFDRVCNYHYLGFRLWTRHLTRSAADGHRRAGHSLRRPLRQVRNHVEDILIDRCGFVVWPFLEHVLRSRGGSKTHNTGRSLAAAAEVLANRRGLNAGQPAFVFINLMGTHIPYAPPRWALERFVTGAAGMRPTHGLLQHINRLGMDVRNWLEADLSEIDKNVIQNLYDAEVAAQDLELGRFFRLLRDCGAMERTLLMVVADHGEHLGEKQRINHLHGAYAELVHVPLIVRDPLGYLARGEIVEPRVSTRRLFHTALAAAGAATPGEDELSLVKNPGAADLGGVEQGAVFAEAPAPTWALRHLQERAGEMAQPQKYAKHDRATKAVYHGDYKLVLSGGDRWELYDVRQDPREQFDLSGDLPAQVARMRRMLEEFAHETGPVGPAVARVEQDPEVIQRLRDLGYLD